MRLGLRSPARVGLRQLLFRSKMYCTTVAMCRSSSLQRYVYITTAARRPLHTFHVRSSMLFRSSSIPSATNGGRNFSIFTKPPCSSSSCSKSGHFLSIQLATSLYVFSHFVNLILACLLLLPIDSVDRLAQLQNSASVLHPHPWHGNYYDSQGPSNDFKRHEVQMCPRHVVQQYSSTTVVCQHADRWQKGRRSATTSRVAHDCDHCFGKVLMVLEITFGAVAAAAAAQGTCQQRSNLEDLKSESTSA